MRTDMSEQDLLNDLLNQEKQMLSSYAACLSEASCKSLCKLLTGNFNQTSQDHYQVFDRMRQKGYYQVRDATNREIQQARTAIKSMQNELQS